MDVKKIKNSFVQGSINTLSQPPYCDKHENKTAYHKTNLLDLIFDSPNGFHT